MNSFKLHKISAALVVCFSLSAWQAVAETPSIPKPAIPNFHQVNERVFRGGQPSPEHWEGLAKMGVKTVIDLRRDGEEEHSIAAEEKAVTAAGKRAPGLVPACRGRSYREEQVWVRWRPMHCNCASTKPLPC